MAPIADLIVLLLKSMTYAPSELKQEIRAALQPQGVRFLLQPEGDGWSGVWRDRYRFRVTAVQDPWLGMGGRYTWEISLDGQRIGAGPADTLEEACAEMLILTR
jgi:hypothetical protein